MFGRKKASSSSSALKASLAYTICSIVQRALSFLTMPLFTRMLTQEQYGLYTVYSSWSAIFTIIITLNLAFGSFSNAMLKYEGRREKYISAIQSIAMLLSIIFLGIYLPFSSSFNELLSLTTPLVILMVGEILMQFGLQCWFGLKRFEYKYKGIILVTILSSILSPILAIILIVNTEDKGAARIYGYAITTIVIGGIIFIHNIIKGRTIFSKEFWKFALRFNLPLLAYYFSQVVFQASDRIVIERLAGMDKAAIYGVAASIALILTFVLNSIDGSYVPWLYEKIKNKEHTKNRNISIIITIIMCTLVGGVIWIAPELVNILGGEEYAEGVYLVAPLSISLILLLYAQFFINVEFYYEEKWKLVMASIGAAILNVALNIWLIPIYGFIAAAYTTLASYVVFALSNFFAIFNKIKKGGELYKIYNLPVLLILLGAFVGMSYLGVFLYPYAILRYGIIAIVIIVLLIYSKRLLAYYRKRSSGETNVEGEMVMEENNTPVLESSSVEAIEESKPEEKENLIITPVKSKARLSNFDFLKIIAFIMVVFLHYNNTDMGGGLRFADGGALVFFKVIESICIIAVPLFILITGYFSYKNKSFSIKKIVGLYIMLFSYRIICYICEIAFFKADFGLSRLVSLFIPNNYYINFYALLMVLSPFINKLFTLNRKNVFSLLIILTILLIVFPTVVVTGFELAGIEMPLDLSFISTNGDNGGYTIVAFILYYLVGAAIHFYDFKTKKFITISIFLFMTLLLTLVSYKISMWRYNNVLVFVSAISLFLFFKEIHIKEIKWISYIASASLGVFILHTTNFFVFDYNSLFNIEENVTSGGFMAIGNMMLVVFSTAIICVVVDMICRLITKPLKKELYSYNFMNYKIIDLKDSDSING